MNYIIIINYSIFIAMFVCTRGGEYGARCWVFAFNQ